MLCIILELKYGIMALFQLSCIIIFMYTHQCSKKIRKNIQTLHCIRHVLYVKNVDVIFHTQMTQST